MRHFWVVFQHCVELHYFLGWANIPIRFWQFALLRENEVIIHYPLWLSSPYADVLITPTAHLYFKWNSWRVAWSPQVEEKKWIVLLFKWFLSMNSQGGSANDDWQPTCQLLRVWLWGPFKKDPLLSNSLPANNFTHQSAGLKTPFAWFGRDTGERRNRVPSRAAARQGRRYN